MKWGNSMQEFAKILSNVKIANDIWKMELKTGLAKTAKPGQFFEITVPGFYLRRPISISEIKEDVKASFDNGELKIVVPKESPKQIEENKFIPIE